MPKQARCFFTEDNDLLAENTTVYLELGGHVVVAKASNMSNALQLVAQLESLGVTVAILDGNLTDNDSSGDDGRRIAEEIRALPCKIHIICLSLKEYDWADECITKQQLLIAWMNGERNILSDTIDRF